MIPVSSAISVDHAPVHHQSSAFTLISSPQSFQSFADDSAKECDLGHIKPTGGDGRPREVPSSKGGLSVAKLITQNGADMRLPDLREILAGDCPRARSSAVVDRCGVQLSAACSSCPEWGPIFGNAAGNEPRLRCRSTVGVFVSFNPDGLRFNHEVSRATRRRVGDYGRHRHRVLGAHSRWYCRTHFCFFVGSA